MNPKRENDNFDIVTEAEAVLSAYSERCKIYERRCSKKDKPSHIKKTVIALFSVLSVVCCLYFIINYF